MSALTPDVPRSTPASAPAPASGEVPAVVGILGAGRAGTALARALARIPRLSPGTAAPRVLVAGSRRPRAVQRHLTVYAPQAVAVEPAELADAQVTVLAVPREALDTVDPAQLAGPGTLAVVDMTNAWGTEPVPAWLEPGPGEAGGDAEDAGADAGDAATAPVIGTARLAAHWGAAGLRAPVVRAFSEMSHHGMDSTGRAVAPRRALAVGTDPRVGPWEPAAVERAGAAVVALVEAMGFTAVAYEGFGRAAVLEPGAAGFGDEHAAPELAALLGVRAPRG